MYDIISSKACTFITLTPDLRHRLGKSLAGEWAPRGVRVNMVSPGYIDTDMSTGSAGGKVWSDEWMRCTPVGRFGTPKEVADMLVVMASDKTTYASLDSSYCRGNAYNDTGQVHDRDGHHSGWRMCAACSKSHEWSLTLSSLPPQIPSTDSSSKASQSSQ